MKRKYFLALGVLLLVAVATAYALISAYYEFQNTLQIKGVGVRLWHWISDTEPPTELITSHDWGKLAGGETGYFEYIVLENYGTENITLSFSTDLNSSIGTVKWEIEYFNDGQWHWRDWEQALAEGIFYIPGHAGNPVRPGQMIGMRPENPQDLDVGRIRIALTVASDAPFGSVDPFTITVTGTELAN